VEEHPGVELPGGRSSAAGACAAARLDSFGAVG
jgi:hypothetical protein